MRSAKVKITGSYAHDNGQLGISAVGATNLKIVGTEVAFNATDPSIDIGLSGGLKLNGVIGLVMKKNYVHDNAGGAGSGSTRTARTSRSWPTRPQQRPR